MSNPFFKLLDNFLSAGDAVEGLESPSRRRFLGTMASTAASPLVPSGQIAEQLPEQLVKITKFCYQSCKCMESNTWIFILIIGLE